MPCDVVSLSPAWLYEGMEIANEKLESKDIYARYSKLENSRLKLLNYYCFCIK